MTVTSELETMEHEPEQELVIGKVNAIARIIYLSRGYIIPEGYDFSKAHHPMEMECWDAAISIWEELFGYSPDLYENWIPPGCSER